MRLLVSTTLAALMVASNHDAQAQALLGLPEVKCVTFIELIDANDPFAGTVQAWMLGYASGLNAMWKDLKGTDRLSRAQTAATRYAVTFCRSNPDKTVLSAMNEYFFSLPQ
ncbi:HdeA/HdeB family chaperone [Bradyrhizobium sp. URHD0069]|uniref:HdeA/HdeB family chaperone n=1 Tax=Bradyrhizobium sp. URHD0069 TaxID=1380355 RepID=UPI000496DE39|nr:HdeA/HdeB family chaperone [Bradyrhizobium sp. URHD0069]